MKIGSKHSIPICPMPREFIDLHYSSPLQRNGKDFFARRFAVTAPALQGRATPGARLF